MAKKHSKNFNKVKWYYNHGQWNKYRVWMAVNRWITADEYKEITGEDWDPNHKPKNIPTHGTEDESI